MSCRLRRGYRRLVQRLTAYWGILKWPSLGEFGWPPGIAVHSVVSELETILIAWNLPSMGSRDLLLTNLRSRNAQIAMILACELSLARAKDS